MDKKLTAEDRYKPFGEGYIRRLMLDFNGDRISFGRLVELLNEKAQEFASQPEDQELDQAIEEYNNQHGQIEELISPKEIRMPSDEEVELEAQEGIQGKYQNPEDYNKKTGWKRNFDDDYIIGFRDCSKWFREYIEKQGLL